MAALRKVQFINGISSRINSFVWATPLPAVQIFYFTLTGTMSTTLVTK